MAQSSQFSTIPPKRKVWVLNRHPQKAYIEKYRDTEYTIPPAGEKKVIMDLTMAEKFLSQGTQLQEVDNAGREISMGKPLYWIDLTDEEREEFDPHTFREINKELKTEETRCQICGEKIATQKGLGLHLKRAHPEYEPVKAL